MRVGLKTSWTSCEPSLARLGGVTNCRNGLCSDLGCEPLADTPTLHVEHVAWPPFLSTPTLHRRAPDQHLRSLVIHTHASLHPAVCRLVGRMRQPELLRSSSSLLRSQSSCPTKVTRLASTTCAQLTCRAPTLPVLAPRRVGGTGA